jgi:hypothetical protein
MSKRFGALMLACLSSLVAIAGSTRLRADDVIVLAPGPIS